MTQLYRINVKLSEKPKKESFSVVLIEKAKQLFWDWIITHWLGLIHCMRQKILSIGWKRTTIWIKVLIFDSQKRNIRRPVGASLSTKILSLGGTLAPTIGKTLGLSALAGLASEGVSHVIKRSFGNEIQNGGVYHPAKYNRSVNSIQHWNARTI